MFSNVESQQLDHANHLAVNSRLLVRRQTKHDFQTCCGEHLEETVDDAWQIVDADDRELQTQLQRRLIPHLTRHASLTQSPRGWWRKCVDCHHHLPRCCVTSVWIVGCLAAFHQSSSKELSARCWTRADWIVVSWRTTGLRQRCRFSPSYWRGSCRVDFRPILTATTWCQKHNPHTDPSTAQKRYFPKCTTICCWLSMMDRSLCCAYSLRHCRSWSAVASAWETVRAACSSPVVVHEWQIVQSFVLWFHDVHGVHRVLGPPRFCPRSAVICLIHRWPGRSLRGTMWRYTRLPTAHSCIIVSALSSWRYGVIGFTSWMLSLGSRLLDVFQRTQVERWQNWAALGCI